MPTLTRQPADAPPQIAFQQRQLWFLNQLAPDNTAYNCGYEMELHGPLDPRKLRRAVLEVLARHETLRTRFTSIDGLPAPRVADDYEGAFQYFDLRKFAPELRAPHARKLTDYFARLPFRLCDDLPVRFVLLQRADDAFTFAYYPHHIVWERRSTEQLFAELEALYVAPGSLPPLPFQFSDYAAWQQESLTGDHLERLQTFWREHLAGLPTRTELPTDRPHPSYPSDRGARYPLTLAPDLLSRVDALARDTGASAYRIFLSAFQVWLAGVTGQTGSCVGTPVTPILPRELEPVIGLFAHTVVVPARLEPDLDFRALLARTSGAVTQAIRRALPFDLIVHAVHPPRDPGRTPLFQTNFRTVKDALAPLALPGIDATPPVWVDNQTSKFDLSMELVASGESGGFVEYRTDLFDAATIARYAQEWADLLDALVAAPDLPLEQAHSRLRTVFARSTPCPKAP